MSHLIKVLTVFFLLGTGTSIQAQNTIPATGGNAAGDGGTASYSIGQLVYTTYTSASNNSEAQGVQQAFEISIKTAIEQSEYISLVCSAYPNPTNDFLSLKIEDFSNKSLYYKLFDENGKLLENKRVISNETIISMENHLPAIYFLRVTDHQKEIKTFKIIKD